MYISVKRNYCSVIGAVNELGDSIGLKNLYESNDSFIILMTFFNSDYINISLCSG